MKSKRILVCVEPKLDELLRERSKKLLPEGSHYKKCGSAGWVMRSAAKRKLIHDDPHIVNEDGVDWSEAYEGRSHEDMQGNV